jgi:hypothetical protein
MIKANFNLQSETIPMTLLSKLSSKKFKDDPLVHSILKYTLLDPDLSNILQHGKQSYLIMG